MGKCLERLFFVKIGHLVLGIDRFFGLGSALAANGLAALAGTGVGFYLGIAVPTGFLQGNRQDLLFGARLAAAGTAFGAPGLVLRAQGFDVLTDVFS